MSDKEPYWSPYRDVMLGWYEKHAASFEKPMSDAHFGEVMTDLQMRLECIPMAEHWRFTHGLRDRLEALKQ